MSSSTTYLRDALYVLNSGNNNEGGGIFLLPNLCKIETCFKLKIFQNYTGFLRGAILSKLLSIVNSLNIENVTSI